jgi:hypothetical protein
MNDEDNTIKNYIFAHQTEENLNKLINESITSETDTKI